MLWRLRDRALLMRASETPQIHACLRRLAVRPRQASSWSVVQAKIDGSKPHPAEINRRKNSP
ncbi:hypothetical protein NBRC111894_3515 [Sporolactobacillus inulinus]|uniref:Uncharacterized protein n=1 Tax=Sporolactobacillus inulinus TaxID=2078 RepID=A0A4Y1ZG74_9BACL|nr:hypothetical protein NBRC111894_3515 [Sporolactobacillus inulinus]